MSTSKVKEKDKELEKTEGSPDSTQIETLKKQKQSYEATKKSTKTKQMLQMAAAAAFAVAAIIAFFSKTKEVASTAKVVASLEATAAAATTAGTSSQSRCSAGDAAACAEITVARNVQAAAAKIRKRVLEDAKSRDNLTPSLNESARLTTSQAQITPEIEANKTTAATSPVVKSYTQKAQDALDSVWNYGANLFKSNTPSASPPSIENKPYTGGNYMMPSGAMLEQKVKLPLYSNSNFLEKIINTIFSSAHAGTMGLLMLGGGAAIAMILGKTLGVKIDTYIPASKNRGIIWGVLAGLSFMAASSSTKNIKKIDENIKKIDDTLKGLEGSTSNGTPVVSAEAPPEEAHLGEAPPAVGPSTTSPNDTTTDSATQPATGTASTKSIANGATQPNLSPTAGNKSNAIGNKVSKNEFKKSTITGSTSPMRTAARPEAVDAFTEIRLPATQRTSCLDHDGDTNCKSIRSMAMTTPGFQQLPISIQQLASEALAIGDDLSGTNVLKISTQMKIQTLGSKQPEIAKLLELRKANLNNQLVQNRFAPINFAGEENVFLTSANNDVARVLREKNMTPEKYLSSIGHSLFDNDLGSSTKNETYGNSYEKRSGGTSPTENPLNPAVDLPKSASGEILPVKGNEEHELDIGTNDINTNADTSIFDVISSRYIKSAYRRLIDEEIVEQK